MLPHDKSETRNAKTCVIKRCARLLEDVCSLRVGGIDDTGEPVHGNISFVSELARLSSCAGPIPKCLGALTKLTVLILSGKQLPGKSVTFVVYLYISCLVCWSMK